MRDYRNEYKYVTATLNNVITDANLITFFIRSFTLHYYTSSYYQTQEAILSISTRGSDEAENPDIPLSTLDKIIRTKCVFRKTNYLFDWLNLFPIYYI